MTKRQSWNNEQDKLIKQLITSYQQSNKKIKWSQIAQILKQQHYHWKRTGKQCRQRWLNHLKPSINNLYQIDHIDLKVLLNLIRIHGKKWSMIAREMEGVTDNTVKNFFYASWRKGIRNLNIYNTKIRRYKKYKIYKQDLIDKILSVNDIKKNKYLYIGNNMVYQLAKNIQQIIISCSIQDINFHHSINQQFLNQYQQLNNQIITFCRMCKFKKSKARKNSSKEDKFQIFTRKKQVKIDQKSHQLDNDNQLLKDISIKIQNQSIFSTSNSFQQKNIQNNSIQIDIVNEYQNQNDNYCWKRQSNLDLSLLVDQQNKSQIGSLFQILSYGLPREVDLNSILY